MKERCPQQSRDVGRRFLAAVLWLAVVGGPAAWAQLPDGYGWSFRPLRPAPSYPASPPLPAYPVQLVLDDDGNAEGAYGVTVGPMATAQQFLWLNQFDRTLLPNLELQEIWVLFPPGPNMAVGAAVDLVVYLDPDANPANGAIHLATIPETIQAVDGVTFSVYPLATPMRVTAPGDLLIGVISRFVVSGVTSSTNPAALDTTASQGRSWVALWVADPPDPPTLPPDLQIDPVDVFVAGNFLIRGFGRPLGVTEVPTVGRTGLALLALLLAGAGLALRPRC